MESVMAKGLITEEEMNERLAFATARWRTAQAELERLREENLQLRNRLADEGRRQEGRRATRGAGLLLRSGTNRAEDGRLQSPEGRSRK